MNNFLSTNFSANTPRKVSLPVEETENKTEPTPNNNMPEVENQVIIIFGEDQKFLFLYFFQSLFINRNLAQLLIYNTNTCYLKVAM